MYTQSHFQVIFPIEFLTEFSLINSFLHHFVITGVISLVYSIVLKTVEFLSILWKTESHQGSNSVCWKRLWILQAFIRLACSDT